MLVRNARTGRKVREVKCGGRDCGSVQRGEGREGRAGGHKAGEIISSTGEEPWGSARGARPPCYQSRDRAPYREGATEGSGARERGGGQNETDGESGGERGQGGRQQQRARREREQTKESACARVLACWTLSVTFEKTRAFAVQNDTKTCRDKPQNRGQTQADHSTSVPS